MPVCFGDRVFLIALFLENMRANGTVISGKRGQELAMSNKKSRLKKLIIAQLHVFSHTPATAANGSHELSSCHSYSALLAISRLFSRVPIPPGMSSTSNPPEPAMAASATPHGPQLLLTEAFLLRHNCNLCLGLQKTEHFKRSVKVEKFETIEENCTHVDW